MSIKESFAGKDNQVSRVAGNIVFPDFAARIIREVIVGISEPGSSNVVEFPKVGRENTYNPGKRVKKVLDPQINLVRLRRRKRASKCRTKGDHSRGECGSSNCRVSQSMKEYRRSVEKQIFAPRARRKLLQEVA